MASVISDRVTISDNPSEVFVTRFSPDGKLVAAGCGDGAIRVFSTDTGKLHYELNGGKADALPVTALRFRPHTSASRTKNVLLAVNAEGEAQHWHITSGKCLHSIKEEGDNQLFTVDYRPDGQLFATAGKDYTVRVYDEATKALVTELSGGLGKISPGHSNRVFSLKFNPTDPNIVISGGWDNTVQVWDLRMEHSVRSIFGPHICGDSVDIHGNTILTGSWRPENQLELWDYTTGEKISDVNWHQSKIHGDPCMLYAAQFSKDERGSMFAAGGSGANEAKIFDRGSKTCIGKVEGLSRGVFSLDFSPCGTKFCVSGGDAAIRLFDLDPSQKGKENATRAENFNTTKAASSGSSGVLESKNDHK